MKHYFIINPAAGIINATNDLRDKLELIFKDKNEKYDIYITEGPGDVSEQIKKVCTENEMKDNPDEYTFYICGGDGSSFEGVNGVYGFKHARLTIVPVGSCNDFLKTFPEYDFTDLELLINGEERIIDVLRVNDFYSLNIANIGFDARVNDDCIRLKSKYKTVKKAYNVAIRKNLFRPLGDKVIVKAVKNDKGQEISLCAEVFLNEEKVKELGIENIEETLKKDVSKATRDLPVWKRVTKTEIRETEFNKTTTNKIKR